MKRQGVIEVDRIWEAVEDLNKQTSTLLGLIEKQQLLIVHLAEMAYEPSSTSTKLTLVAPRKKKNRVRKSPIRSKGK
jgi:hypothetical protein